MRNRIAEEDAFRNPFCTRSTCCRTAWSTSNTLTVQRVLARPHWEGELTQEGLRALTPLIWEHVNPYGTYQLDLDTRLALD